MDLKIACADFTFPLLPHDKVLDLIAMLGVEGVDIGLFENRSHIQPTDILKDIAGSARKLSRKLDDRGLEFADIFLIPGEFQVLAANHPDPEERKNSRDLFERVLEFTVFCEGKHMGALPGIFWENESKKDSLSRSSEELAWRVEKANEAGIIFSVEAHIGSVVPTPLEAIQLVEMTPGLTLTLDYTHFTSIGMPDSEVEPMVKYASHFHVRGGCSGRLQAPFKDNVVDYRRVLEAMKKTGYKGYLGLEYVWVDWEHCNECDNLSETILFRNFLKEEMKSI